MVCIVWYVTVSIGIVVIASYIGLDNAGKILGDMAPTYFVSVAAIVAAFYAKETFTKK